MNNKQRMLTGVGLSVGLIWAASAFAGPGPGKHADTDGDGQISLSEFTARADLRPSAEEQFAAMDANSDGEVSKREMKRYHRERIREHRQRRTESRAAALDEDANGVVTQEEFLAGAPELPTALERFERRDANSDGVLTDDELSRPDRQGPPGDRQQHGRRFAMIDTDGNGTLSLAEFTEHRNAMPTPEERFYALDSDGDGALSDTELKHARRRGPGA